MFAISTSAVSGLLTLVVGRLVATSASALIVWIAVAVCGVGLVSWGASYAIRLTRRKSQRAFLIVSAFDEHGYISSFVQQVHDALEPFDATEYPKNCGYAGYDTAQLGEMAGWWMVDGGW